MPILPLGTCNSPNEPVEVDEPLISPLAISFCDESIVMACDALVYISN